MLPYIFALIGFLIGQELEKRGKTNEKLFGNGIDQSGNHRSSQSGGIPEKPAKVEPEKPPEPVEK